MRLIITEALSYKGTRYAMGGLSYSGIDCSGLVQLAILSQYHNASRNSSQQELELGKTLYTRKNSTTFKTSGSHRSLWYDFIGIFIQV